MSNEMHESRLAMAEQEAKTESDERIREFTNNCLRIGLHNAIITLAQYKEGGDADKLN